MTTIYIDKQEDELIMSISGHSGYAEQGKDIVCASISTLAFTWINQLREFERENIAQITDFQMEDGEILLKFKTEKKEVLRAFETIVTGFSMLEEKFFSNLSLIRGEL